MMTQKYRYLISVENFNNGVSEYLAERVDVLSTLKLSKIVIVEGTIQQINDLSHKDIKSVRLDAKVDPLT